LAELANLGLHAPTRLPLPLTIGVEAACQVVSEPFRRCPEGPPFRPHDELEAIRPHVGVRTEAWATKAIGLGTYTPVRGLGPRPTLAGAGTQRLAGDGIAAVLTWEHALQQRACPTLRRAGRTALFRERLVHRDQHRGLDNGGYRHVNPVCRRPLLVRGGPPWLPRAVPLGPELRAPWALARLADGGAAPRGRILPPRPDDTALPPGASRPCPFARRHEPSADFAAGEPLTAKPRQDWADDTGLIGDEGSARPAAPGMRADRAVARGGATPDVHRAGACRRELAPPRALKTLGAVVFSPQAVPWQAHVSFRAPSSLPV
jgi:hypothetical protein